MMRWQLVVFLSGAFLTGCLAEGGLRAGPRAPNQNLPQATSADPSTLISPDRIGPVQLGMTFAEAKQALPPETQFEWVMLSEGIPAAIAAVQGSEVLLYLVTEGLEDELPPDEAVILLLATRNPRYATAEGVGPGSLLTAAVDAYGEVQLYYSPDAEYATFAQQPARPTEVISFRVQSPANPPAAGLYEWTNAAAGDCTPGATGYCESTEFHPEATLFEITIAQIPSP